jgi:hypothetical protein
MYLYTNQMSLEIKASIFVNILHTYLIRTVVYIKFGILVAAYSISLLWLPYEIFIVTTILVLIFLVRIEREYLNQSNNKKNHEINNNTQRGNSRISIRRPYNNNVISAPKIKRMDLIRHFRIKQQR